MSGYGEFGKMDDAHPATGEFVHGMYNPRRIDVSLACPQMGDDDYDGKTRQDDADACDINKLMANFERSGAIPPYVDRPDLYQDVTGLGDFHVAMGVVARARQAFEALPAAIRRRFDDDAGAFVDFCANSENIEEMRALGILPPADPAELEAKAKAQPAAAAAEAVAAPAAAP